MQGKGTAAAEHRASPLRQFWPLRTPSPSLPHCSACQRLEVDVLRVLEEGCELPPYKVSLCRYPTARPILRKTTRINQLWDTGRH